MSAKRKSMNSPGRSVKKQRKAIDLEMKMKVINDHEAGKKVKAIARDLELASSTISTILKDKDRVKEAAKGSTGFNAVITRQRKGLIHEMEKLLVIWFVEQIQKGMPVSLLIIQAKARSIFETLKASKGKESTETFTASNGWFQRFRRRFNLCNWNFAESGFLVVIENAEDPFDEIIEKDTNNAEQIFIVDETGLYLDFPALQNDLLLRAAKGEQTERVPVWLMRQAGRYLPEYGQAKGDRGFFETCRNPELVCELTIQPVKRFAVDAAIIFSDILVIPIALGMATANDPGSGPVFEKPIQSPEDMDRLNPDFDIQKTLGYVYEAITLTRKALNGQVPLFGFSGAPWTLMKYMIENLGAGPNPNKTRRFLVEFPESGEKLLKIITEAVIRHLVEQIKAGAQIVQVFDSLAGELGPNLFTKYELPCLREISYKVKEKLTSLGISPVPMVVFAKDAHFAVEQLSTIGFDVVSLDWTMPPVHYRSLVGTSVTLQGNLDPVILFTKEDEIRKNVREMLQKFGTQRYIANLGHGVMKDTPPDNVGIFIDAVHSISEELNSQS